LPTRRLARRELHAAAKDATKLDEALPKVKGLRDEAGA